LHAMPDAPIGGGVETLQSSLARPASWVASGWPLALNSGRASRRVNQGSVRASWGNRGRRMAKLAAATQPLARRHSAAADGPDR